MRLLESDRTVGRDRSVDGKDGFRGVVAMDDAFLPLVTNPKVLPTLVALLSANLHLMSSNLISMPSIPPGDRRTIRVAERLARQPHAFQDITGLARETALPHRRVARHIH